ncbi:MAG: hypothetical protein Q8O28_04150 [Smithellaceae bacterium]|nr:hypothetical protein [Smithellaceae bacterium]
MTLKLTLEKAAYRILDYLKGFTPRRDIYALEGQDACYDRKDQKEVELEVTETARKGHVVIPHGFGMVYNGVKYGANVNRLTKNTHRDQFGTPMHRFVPCRVEALS